MAAADESGNGTLSGCYHSAKVRFAPKATCVHGIVAFCSLHHEAVCRPSCVFRRNQSRPARLIAHMSKTGRIPMKTATIILAGTAALAIIGSAAVAQQALTGTVTGVNRLNGMVAIRQTQSGTVGANSGGAAEEFKVQDGLSLDAVHAGDKVTYSATEAGG